MWQLENSHLSKYLATLGVAIIVGTIGFASFALRSSSGDVLLEETQISKLTPVAQHTVETKQGYAEAAIHFLPIGSLLGILLGVFFFIRGIRGWSHRQNVIDAMQDDEAKKLSHEVRQLSPEERAIEAEQAAEEAVSVEINRTDTAQGQSGDSVTDMAIRTLSLTSEISVKLRAAFPHRKVLEGAQVGAHHFDIALIDSESSLLTDAIGIKYFRSMEHSRKRLREWIADMDRMALGKSYRIHLIILYDGTVSDLMNSIKQIMDFLDESAPVSTGPRPRSNVIAIPSARLASTPTEFFIDALSGDRRWSTIG